MNEKKIIFLVIGVIGLVLIVCSSIVINTYNRNKPFVPNMSKINKIIEQDAYAAKSYYDTEEMKEEFITLLNKTLNAVSDKLLDGTVIDPTSLAQAVTKYNKILASNNWKELNLEFPTKWLGTWWLNDAGILKFKFASKDIEPNWVECNEVKEYVILNN